MLELKSHLKDVLTTKVRGLQVLDLLLDVIEMVEGKGLDGSHKKDPQSNECVVPWELVIPNDLLTSGV